ncbi:DNA replication regulator Sld3 C-terminal domain-containing protein [Madurella fahalii]|uniref:DNA replication regulator Sld3 C-terminal domain-containing protein n=1 Tax=Madurella fahalii TaxID=1157608 RepID=A0ABQ0G032_9PEZI
MSSIAGTNIGASRPLSRPSSRASSRPSSRPLVAGILTPSHDARLNQAQSQSQSQSQARPSLHEPSSANSSSGKRKRDVSALAADSLLKAPVVLKPYPSNLTAKPRILHPLMLLPREHLPLSALDLDQPRGDFPASRLFESKIKILDLEDRLGSRIVLLARSETSRVVYAVEHESNGLYALCKLGPWADIERLGESATVVCRERMSSGKPTKPEDTSVTPFVTPLMHKESKRRRLAMNEIHLLVQRRPSTAPEKDSQNHTSALAEEKSGSGSSNGQSTEPAKERAQASAESLSTLCGQDAPTSLPVPSDDFAAQPSAEGIFQNIRAQYFEALYHSKGSLAYFAKGPLSRARAAFHPDHDTNLEMTDLVDFLKSLVMTTVVIDKKYRETVPELVTKIKTFIDDSDAGASKFKKRKPKKPKLGKSGLYPAEDEHIKRWWSSLQPVSRGDEEKVLTAAEIKYHISCLRRRETKLQMILILEILALEPLVRSKDAGGDCQLPEVESQTASREASQEPSTRKRNKHNLPMLLDVHADRLCIWQSTTLDEVKALAESQLPARGDESEKPERANSDPLRDFCVDIVVPFFSARLPGLCDSLNRKLGGPVVQSPPKEKVAKPASAVKPRPGAPVKRLPALKKDSHRTLERALSHERNRRSVSRGPADAIALMRSATTTTIPGLKREASEPLLMGLLQRKEIASLQERPASIFSRSLSSASGPQNPRAKKKAEVEAELKDAISALKKPNRSLAAKELAEAAEKRASVGQLKKLKKPNRAPAIQVKATPANNRFKDALATGTSRSQPGPDLPPSSASVVPSSTLPRKFANRLSNPAGNTDHVQVTPLRQTTFTLPALHETPADGIPSSSPIMARKAAPAAATQQHHQRSQPQYLSVPAGRFSSSEGWDGDIPSSPGLAGLFETPIAPRSRSGVGTGRLGLGVLDDTPIKGRLFVGGAGGGGGRGGFSDKMKESGRTDGEEEERSVKEEVNIYQRLGWDTTDLDDIDVL